MDNRLKLRISRMFRSSFGSCKPRAVSDVVEKAVFAPQNNPQMAHLLRPAAAPERSLPSLCRPACPDPSRSINPACIISAGRDVSRRLPRRSRVLSSIAEHYHYYSPFVPVSAHLYPPSRSFCITDARRGAKTRRKKQKKEAQKHREKEKEGWKMKGRQCHKSRPFVISTSSQDTNTSCDWFSSDDEREEEGDDGHWGGETETLFSSISLSSDDSSAAWRRRRRRRRDRKLSSTSRRRELIPDPERSMTDNIKGSFAVVKRSSDPHGDFRTSMVEMIVERQLFSADDLRRLIRCFLALNSSCHHSVILEVFAEIWETLFSSSPPPAFCLLPQY
ncbi:hypothetical protein SAY86_002670 [Trapa natans]|uniref:Transcription repressor n=1 Tax=Trapa natans TaxID=22666 RepID=A0AAN7LGB9_TRANT|nr:hypothetical protein SAY86_002670 [Trapa natans]